MHQREPSHDRRMRPQPNQRGLLLMHIAVFNITRIISKEAACLWQWLRATDPERNFAHGKSTRTRSRRQLSWSRRQFRTCFVFPTGRTHSDSESILLNRRRPCEAYNVLTIVGKSWNRARRESNAQDSIIQLLRGKQGVFSRKRSMHAALLTSFGRYLLQIAL